MKYVTTIERDAIARGHEEGREEAEERVAREYIMRLLAAKGLASQQIDHQVREQLSTIHDIDVLTALFDTAIDVDSAQAFVRRVDDLIH